ncbi:MAG: hypothetical protein QM668_16035 [Agriterribacter sp.]
MLITRIVWSRSRKGGWAIAQSLILTTTITLERLQQRGYESMPGYYEKVSPQLNEPLYLPAGGKYEVRTYSGVRGVPHRLQAVRPPTRLGEVSLIY